MAESIINYSELIKDDGGFDKLKKDLIELESFVEKEAKKIKSSFKVTDPKNEGEVKKLVAEVDRLNKAYKQLSTTKTKVSQVQRKDVELTQKERIARAKLREETRKQNAEARLVAKISKTQANSIENLRAKLSLVTVAWSKLTAEELKNSQRGKRLVASKKNLTQQLKRSEQATDDYRRSVGKYKTGFNGAISGLRNFAGALGVTVGVTALVGVVKDSIKIFADFEQANANLSAILGKTSDQITELTDDSKRLGSITKFTASEVAGLQTEFAKLGFTTDEILNATEATLNLASATGTDLSQAAKQVGSSLRAFGLDASEAQRVVDVFASSTSKSALDMAFLDTAMTNVAPVANKFGFSIENSTALLGKLADAGFDASSAGTATRNILLNLADGNGKLATALGGPVKTLPELIAGFKKLKTEGIDLAGALDLTDKRSVSAFATFLDQADGIQTLNDSLENANGTAQEMSDTQLDTLSGSMTKLGSAWEGFILSLEDGSGVFSEFLISIIDGVSSILQLASGIEQTDEVLSNLPFGDTIVAIKNFTENWSRAFDSVENFKKAVADTVDIIVSLVTNFFTLGAGIEDFTGKYWGLNNATKSYSAESLRLLRIQKKSLDEGKKIISQNREELSDVQVLVDALGDENLTRDEKNEVIEKLNQDYPELLENIDLETAGTEVLIGLKKALIREILNEAIERKKLLKQQQISDKIIDLQIRQIGLSDKGKKAVQSEIDLYSNAIGLVDEVASQVSGGVEQTVNSMDFSEPFRDQNELIAGLKKRIDALKVSLNGETDTNIIEKTNSQIKDLNGQLVNANKIRTKMLDDALDKYPDVNVGISTSVNGKKGGRGKNSLDKQFKEELKDVSDIFEEFSAKIVIDTDLTSPQQFEEQITLINGVFDGLEKQYENDKVKHAQIVETKLHLLSEANENYLDELDRRDSDRIKKIRDVSELEVEIQNLKNEALLIESDRYLTESKNKIDKLENEFGNATTDSDKAEIQSRIDAEVEYYQKVATAKKDIQTKQIIDDAEFRSKKATEDIKDADILSLELQKIELEKNNSIARLNDDFNKDMNTLEKERVENSITTWEKFAETLKTILEKVFDKVVELAKDEVQTNEDKVAKQSTQVDIQRQRAEDGLTNTLAFEQKAMADREKELIESQKRLARLEKIKALYTSYQSYAQTGDPSGALTKALKDFAIIETITATFEDGGIVGEGVRTDKNGITKGRRHNMRGGVLALHEGGEGFFSRKEVANMGADNFYKLKEMAGTGNFDPSMFKGQRNDLLSVLPVQNNSELIGEVKELNRSVRNQPNHSYEIIGLVNGLKELVVKEKRGSFTRVIHKEIL